LKKNEKNEVFIMYNEIENTSYKGIRFDDLSFDFSGTFYSNTFSRLLFLSELAHENTIENEKNL